MITRFSFGTPINTDAVLDKPAASNGPLPYFTRSADGLSYTISLEPDEKVLGLGEQIRGINKRGWSYTSCCADNPNHVETTHSLYGAHNYLIFMRNKPFGVFFDFPGEITFDIGYTDHESCTITAAYPDMDVYFIEEPTPYEIAKSFRALIGQSYIAPRWAFGYQQSRWGYRNADDVRRVTEAFRANGMPVDAIYLDIDYMDNLKDFTVSPEKFPDFPAFVEEMKQQNIRLVPIIDAGVKIEKGYDVYESGVEGNLFCKREDGSDFVAGVWPGKTHFPDFFKPETRKWFGEYYYRLTEAGIEGFWNDMNEPAIFYSEEELAKAKAKVTELFEGELDVNSFFDMIGTVCSLSNNHNDYKRFYHQINGMPVRHDLVHNLYGYNMTRAAGEAFEAKYPDKRLLLFSRASYTGMHRYGGIWTGDNNSWWSHLLLNIKMMPSLNMAGFLYSGADLGGFGADTSGDLVLRWLEFGIFTPLMRNHSAHDTCVQEPFRFGREEAFRRILKLRYRFAGYLYSEFMKAALSNDLLFRPLCFDYPEDSFAAEVEDQLMLGESIMLAPVYTENASGRYVYLPEDMLMLKFISEETASGLPEGSVARLEDGAPYLAKAMPAGHHHIDVALDEVVVFLRPNRLLPLLTPADSIEELDFTAPELLAYPHGRKEISYNYFCDDGISKNYDLPENKKTLIFTV